MRCCNSAEWQTNTVDRIGVDSRYSAFIWLAISHSDALFTKPEQVFITACNGIFGKVGKCASEDVHLSLVSSKCLPVLLYATEACPRRCYMMLHLDYFDATC